MATDSATLAREGYKQTEIGEMPESWEVATLGAICRVRRGASPRPIRDPRWFAESGPGWVRIADVTRSNGPLRKTTQYLSPDGEARSVRVYPGQVIMSIAATVGLSIMVDMDACIHDGFVVFDRYEGRMTSVFLRRVLEAQRRDFTSQGQTGTQANINTGIVNGVSLGLPPLPEQQAIAEVLQSVDDSIRATQEVIDQQGVVKQGLLQQLLARGIGHTRFKQTEIGEIPESWEEVALADIASVFSGSTPNRSVAEYYGGGIPWVKSGEVNLGVISSTEESLTQAGFSAIGATWVTPGAVLVAMYGATAGKVAVLRIKAAINQAIAAVVGDAGKVGDAFLAKAILSQVPVLMRRAQGSGQPNLNGKSIKELRVPLPPLPEQQAIAEVLQSIDDSIISGTEGLRKLRTLKGGLMQDLLTGKVRVKVAQ